MAQFFRKKCIFGLKIDKTSYLDWVLIAIIVFPSLAKYYFVGMRRLIDRHKDLFSKKVKPPLICPESSDSHKVSFKGIIFILNYSEGNYVRCLASENFQLNSISISCSNILTWKVFYPKTPRIIALHEFLKKSILCTGFTMFLRSRHFWNGDISIVQHCWIQLRFFQTTDKILYFP